MLAPRERCTRIACLSVPFIRPVPHCHCMNGELGFRTKAIYQGDPMSNEVDDILTEFGAGQSVTRS
jgi:hypothetical protein